MVTCTGSDVSWMKPDGSNVDEKEGRVHVEDKSSEGDVLQQLVLIFNRIEEIDHGTWICKSMDDGGVNFTLFIYGMA